MLRARSAYTATAINIGPHMKINYFMQFNQTGDLPVPMSKNLYCSIKAIFIHCGSDFKMNLPLYQIHARFSNSLLSSVVPTTETAVLFQNVIYFKTLS